MQTRAAPATQPQAAALARALSQSISTTINSMSDDAVSLLKVLALFGPTPIRQSTISPSKAWLPEGALSFLRKLDRKKNAVAEIKSTGLVDRFRNPKFLSLPSFLCTSTIAALSAPEKSFYLDAVVMFLSGVHKATAEVGEYDKKVWERTEESLGNLKALLQQQQEHSIAVLNPKALAELLLETAWHHYKTEDLKAALDMLGKGFGYYPDESEYQAKAQVLHGLIYLEQNSSAEALANFESALSSRQENLAADHELIASTYYALSLAHTELGNFEPAVECGRKATEIRRRNDSCMLGQSLSAMASTLLRMGHAAAAEGSLRRSLALTGKGLAQLLETGDLKYASDAMLYARIMYAKADSGDAAHWAKAAYDLRTSKLGKCRRTSDSAYWTGLLLEKTGDLKVAEEWLAEAADIANEIGEKATFGARAKYRQSKILLALGAKSESEALEKEAKASLKRGEDGAAVPDVPGQEWYDKLVPWFLH